MLSRKLIISFLVFFVGFFVSQNLIYASTIVTDDIIEDTTWTLAGSPYVVQNDIVVLSEATLTIEPGVIVKFFTDGSRRRLALYVLGKIIANGEEDNKIYFTSLWDDSIGGDTNGDGDSTIPIVDRFSGEGLWDAIYFQNSTGSSFKNTHFRYSFNTLELTSSSVNFENLSVIDGIYGLTTYNNSYVDINGGVFKNIEVDPFVLFNFSTATLDNVHILNSVYGIQLYNGSNLSISNSKLENIHKSSAFELYNDSYANILNMEVGDESNNSGGLAVYGSKVDIADSIFKNGKTGIEVYDLIFRGYKSELNASGLEISGYDSGLEFYGGTTYIEKTKIFGNYIGLEVYSNPNATIVASNIVDNVYAVSVYGTTIINAINNFWGDASGPYHFELNPEGLGNEVSDNVLFDPWCENEDCVVVPTHNPVIIVPGLLGTEIWKPAEDEADEPEKLWLDIGRNFTDKGDEFMDALQFKSDLTPSETLTIGEVIRKKLASIFTFDYSNGLVEEFENQGYVEGMDLFLFPFDWRYGANEDNVNKLKQKIVDVLTETDAEKVDVIAHSTGGLLVKKYVVENPATHNIDKAIFVGVPNTGAPKAIKALIVGDGFGVPFLAEAEMKKIAKNLPVAYDLLPSRQYYDSKGSYLRIIETRPFGKTSRDLIFEEANDFLIDYNELNEQALTDARSLHTVDFDNYDLRTAGVDLYAVDGCKAGTIGIVEEVRHFTLFDSENYSSRYQVKEIPGDGTVPLESSTNLPINQANKHYALKASHASMMSQDGIRHKIVNIISGSDLETANITQDISKCKLKGRAIAIFSPLSIDVTDQDGNHLGLASDGVSIENNIPNADFNIIDEHKFVYLPTDDGKTFTITVAGTGTGTFTITDATITENNIIQTQVFSNISVTPSLLGSISISNDTNTILSLDVDGNGTTDQTLEPTSILDATASQDFVPEHLDDNSSSNNTENNTHTTSGSRGNRVVQVSQNNTITQDTLNLQSNIVAEIPVKDRVLKQKNTTNSELVVKDMEQTSVEALVQENTLTANVADSDAPINYGAIQITLAGCIIVLLVVKRFIKL